MENKNNLHKNIVFLFIMGFLFCSMIQQNINLIPTTPLKGSFTTKENPNLTSGSWFAGSYQEQKNGYLNENFGFRNLCVRINNQIAYSFFDHAKANGVLIGKENYLYEDHYIRTYLGEDYIGQNEIIDKTAKLKKLQEKLKSKNKDLIVVITPGKGSFYPEFIPDKYDINTRSTTNYEGYIEELNKNKINLIDFNLWFRQMKDTISFPLYPKTGIHWSKYGELLAADSLLHYIGDLRNVVMPKIEVNGFYTSHEMEKQDDDIEKSMNLLFNITDLEMAYPQFQIKKDHLTKPSPKVLTIGDSFFWGMFNFGLSKTAFNDGKFWYYNKQIFPDNYDKPTLVEDVNIIEEVEKNDVIILMSTDANLHKFAYGFIDQLHDAYFKTGVIDHKKRILEGRINGYIKSIKETPKWLEKVTKQAQEKNITIEKAIRENAEYMVWKEDQK